MAADRTTTASTGSPVQKGLLESHKLNSNNADKQRGPGTLETMDSEGRQNFSRQRREPSLEVKETARIPEFSRGILIVDSAEQDGLLDADEVCDPLMAILKVQFSLCLRCACLGFAYPSRLATFWVHSADVGIVLANSCLLHALKIHEIAG